MNRNSKDQLISELAEKLATAKAAFLADYRGLNVEKVNTLRGELRKAGVEYQVVKNTLLRIAAKNTGVECLEKYLEGPTAIAIVQQDPVAPAKVLSDFAKANDKFELKVGALDGKVLSIEDIKALSELPSREVLLAKVLGSLNAPASNFVGVLAAIPRSLVQVLAAIQDKKAA
ncbi:50S ribosomal protein L10 [Desulfuromonas versatilis]|uniref:Large ribosomal subunit protein uL10 n=1 Tax=Desulfuromonas versatilis TaxID=2802975 RepID=A0ABN6DV97_9BACT|nr:50S ribosomal protein L10 [Desulfuromonas versatilis]BCR04033.1 50S ribosomal protein L10 [Desulfuromonas versatilis]